jgi:chromatin assembly factor 1 subunit B
MTSSDGFCSTLTFGDGELGVVHIPEVAASTSMKRSHSSSSSHNTPIPTPTSGIAPPSPFYIGSHHQRTSSNPLSVAPSPPALQSSSQNTYNSFFAGRPSSPTRSNSTSSVATQASVAHHASASTVISNPPLVSGSMPSITAANSSFASGLNMTTPPQTPRSTASSVVGNKRDASESEREDGKVVKKRRIAPTRVTNGGEGSSNGGSLKQPQL